MSEASSPVQVLFSDEFQERLRILAKRDRHIQFDLQPLLNEPQSGNFNGDKIPGTGYTVLKVRLKNSDIQKGKSAGHRVIYQLRNSACVLLLVIYSKSDQIHIAADKIRTLIDNVETLDS